MIVKRHAPKQMFSWTMELLSNINKIAFFSWLFKMSRFFIRPRFYFGVGFFFFSVNTSCDDHTGGSRVRPSCVRAVWGRRSSCPAVAGSWGWCTRRSWLPPGGRGPRGYSGELRRSAASCSFPRRWEPKAVMGDDASPSSTTQYFFSRIENISPAFYNNNKTYFIYLCICIYIYIYSIFENPVRTKLSY